MRHEPFSFCQDSLTSAVENAWEGSRVRGKPTTAAHFPRYRRHRKIESVTDNVVLVLNARVIQRRFGTSKIGIADAATQPCVQLLIVQIFDKFGNGWNIGIKCAFC